MKTKEIAKELDADRRQISMWASKYCKGNGINGLIGKTGGKISSKHEH